jgi:hypothetical protein
MKVSIFIKTKKKIGSASLSFHFLNLIKFGFSDAGHDLEE